jgi:DNA primase
MEGLNAIALIESRFGITLKQVGQFEWCGPCPHCGGTDRWHFWTDKLNWWCRPGPGHCGKQGFLDQLVDGIDPPTPEQRLEWRIAKLEQKQREHEERLSLLEQMHRCTDHIRYHEGLTEQAREYWWSEGITDESIDKYLLGWCSSCPMYRQSGSYTIPIINNGKLENIRHRLAHPNGGGKYRPHIAGLQVSLFNADLLDGKPDRIIVSEGEKKSIVLTQTGFPAVGITGKRAFRREWLKWFDGIGRVYILLDPDAQESANKLGAFFNGRARVANLPVKADDMIVKYGAGSADIEAVLRLARPVEVG